MATGSAVGTATDIDGNYTISVEPTGSLTFSYVGFNTQTVSVDQPHGYQCDNEREFGRA